MGATPIQWTDHSINPIRARGPNGRNGHHCVKVSPGCKNCYASRFQPRVGLPQFQEQRGEKTPEMFLDPKMLAQVLRRKKPTKFFWCDMTDMFGDWVPNEWIAACFGVMAATPQHTHQVLTKRSKRMREWFAWISGLRGALGVHPVDTTMGCMSQAARFPGLIGPMTAANQRPTPAWPLANVHLGVSAEDQERFDERVEDLQRTPAAVRWVSAEPLLGPIDAHLASGRAYFAERSGVAGPVRWIVVGGESGKKARPFDLAWGMDIVTQCRAANVPVFMKQIGSKPVYLGQSGKTEDSHGGDMAEWPEDLRVREFPR